jgi:hypothetical protein
VSAACLAGTALLASGCAGPACLLPGQRPMVVAELFFGRGIPGGETLSEDEWRAFAAEIVTPHFPDGFTAYDGYGQWRNPATGEIARDLTKVLLVAAPMSPDLDRRLLAVIEAYKTRFRQQSVGAVTRASCAVF